MERIPFVELFDILQEGILVCTETELIEYVNPFLLATTGLSPDAFIGRTSSQIFGVKVNYRKYVEKQVPHFECEVDCSDGQTMWVKVTETHMNEPEACIIYTVTEILNKSELQKKLFESETRFSYLADSSPVMIWMTDNQLQSFYFNKAWLTFTGRKLEDEQGVGWIKSVHPEDRNLFDTISEAISNNSEYSLEYRLKRQDGAYRDILEIGSPRFYSDGVFAGYVGSCIDITDLKNVQKELTNQTRELKRSNEELEQFAYAASHDLQEPLRMVNSYVQLIRTHIGKGALHIESNKESIEEFMHFVVDGVHRMQALINDLLEYSRVSRKGEPFKKVNLNDVLGVVKEHLKSKIESSGVVLHLADMPEVFGDYLQLVRLFQNLMDNAIKFRSTDSPVVEVKFSETDGKYVITVSDNGIGIDEQFRDRIFVIFQRLHSIKDYEGTGIGLALCKKIVERHNGEIWVEPSGNGSGSAFRFTIPKMK